MTDDPMTRTKTKLRRLTPAGIEQLGQWLMADLPALERPSEIIAPPPVHILQEPGLSEPLDGSIQVDDRPIGDAMDFAVMMTECIGREALTKLREDIGFWSAVTLHFIDVIYPARENGSRPAKDGLRYILNGGKPSVIKLPRHHRHLAWTPVYLYLDLGHNSRMFLHRPLDKPIDVIEPMMGRSEMRGITPLIEAMHLMYFDDERKVLLRGAGASRKTPGAPRRGGARDFIEVMSQFQRHWALRSMTVEEILDLVPAPGVFDRWLDRARKQLRRHAKASSHFLTTA